LKRVVCPNKKRQLVPADVKIAVLDYRVDGEQQQRVRHSLLVPHLPQTNSKLSLFFFTAKKIKTPMVVTKMHHGFIN